MMDLRHSTNIVHNIGGSESVINFFLDTIDADEYTFEGVRREVCFLLGVDDVDCLITDINDQEVSYTDIAISNTQDGENFLFKLK